MLNIMSTTELDPEELSAFKLASEIEGLLDSLKVGTKTRVGKEGIDAKDLDFFCASYKGEYSVVFKEEESYYELFKIPKGASYAWIKKKIVSKNENATYEQTIEKFTDKIKKHLIEYLESPIDKLGIYENSEKAALMQAELVVSYSYIQRRIGSIIHSDNFIRRSSTVGASDFLKEVLKHMIDQGILVELDRRYAANFNTYARLFGINVENLK